MMIVKEKSAFLLALFGDLEEDYEVRDLYDLYLLRRRQFHFLILSSTARRDGFPTFNLRIWFTNKSLVFKFNEEGFRAKNRPSFKLTLEQTTNRHSAVHFVREFLAEQRDRQLAYRMILEFMAKQLFEETSFIETSKP